MNLKEFKNVLIAILQAVNFEDKYIDEDNLEETKEAIVIKTGYRRLDHLIIILGKHGELSITLDKNYGSFNDLFKKNDIRYEIQEVLYQRTDPLICIDGETLVDFIEEYKNGDPYIE